MLSCLLLHSFAYVSGVLDVNSCPSIHGITWLRHPPRWDVHRGPRGSGKSTFLAALKSLPMKAAKRERRWNGRSCDVMCIPEWVCKDVYVKFRRSPLIVYFDLKSLAVSKAYRGKVGKAS